MISAETFRFVRNSCMTIFPVMAALALLSPVNAQTPATGKPTPESPTPNSTAQPRQTQPLNPQNPNVLRPVTQSNSVLSMTGGQRLMKEASSAVSAQNYDLAKKKLEEARGVFNQVSNFYQDLGSSFSGIDNRIADAQRQKALEAAQMRDDATYQLALVHRAQNKPELAVPLLVQIIRSQNPTRDLGKKAYQQLFELGFVDTPFPRTGNTGDSPKKSEAGGDRNSSQSTSSTKQLN